MIAFFGALACANTVQSQPPVPGTGESKSNPPNNQTKSDQSKPAIDDRGTENSPVIVRLSKSTEEAAQDQNDRENEATNKRQTLWLTGFTVMALVAQIWILYRQNEIMKAQNCIVDGQRRTTDAMLASNKQIERAYVGFGTWLSIDRKPDKPKFSMTVQFLNFGNTPAEIDKVVLAFDVGEQIAKQPPIYEREIPTEPIRVFLVKRGEFFLINRRFEIPEWANVERGDKVLRLLGYIEYTDRFKQRHRAGYGRVYTWGAETKVLGDFERPSEPETLPFETAPNYNYDEERKEG